MDRSGPLDEELAFRLLEAAPDGFVVTDADGAIVWVNSATERMFGWPRTELVGELVEVLVPERLRETYRSHRARFATAPTHRPMGVERRLRGLRRDGTELAVDLALSPIETRQGRFVLASVRDDTERERTEEALRVGEERLQRAQRVAGLGSWEWDIRAGKVTRSPELYGLYGVQVSSDFDDPFALTALIPADERERVVESVVAAVRDGRSYKLEHRVVRPDGQERVFLQQGETFMANGTPERCVGTTLDITELRKAEREREVALRELEAVLEQCPVGITIFRGPGAQRLEPNRMARAMQGEPFEASAGLAQYAGALTTFDGTPLEYDAYPGLRALRGERLERVELVFRRPDGSAIPIEVNAAPILDAEGRVTGAVAAWQDMTAAKELERLRAEWNSVVAHDLRQPINSISLYAQMLARQSQGWSEDARSCVAEIRKMVSRLARMTSDLLDLSRLDASRLTVVRRPVDVAACVRDAVRRIAMEAPEDRFDVQVRGPIPTVEADPDRIAQVMENLLTNALKYAAAGTPIRVVVERSGGEVVVTVRNDGAVLSPQQLERVFQRFERAGVSSHKAVPGIGLGLQIVQGLVEAHGGRVTAESTPGGETTFRFTLPIGAAP